MATYLEAIQQALREEAERDPKVIFLGEDIGVYGGFKGQDRGLFERFGSERVIDCPMHEASQAGISIGLAIGGRRPVLELMFAEFLTEVAEQLANWAAVTHYLTAGRQALPMVVRTAPGIAENTSHTQIFEAWYAQVPGLKVIAPATAADAKGMLKSAIRDPNPVLVFEHSMLLESGDDEAVGGADDLVPIGSARVAREGDEVTIAAHGFMVRRALAAAEELAAAGISAEVLDLRTLAPFPEDDLVAAVSRTGALCFVQEDWPRCSVASEALAVVAERCHGELRSAPLRVCPPPVPIATNRALHPHLIPTPERIAAEVAEALGAVAAR
jgi:pyruvate/2-oxoglutarate/acetoin dehydrogenase E1 component